MFIVGYGIITHCIKIKNKLNYETFLLEIIYTN